MMRQRRHTPGSSSAKNEASKRSPVPGKQTLVDRRQRRPLSGDTGLATRDGDAATRDGDAATRDGAKAAPEGWIDRQLDTVKQGYSASKEWVGDKIAAGKEWVDDKVETVKQGYEAFESSDAGWSNGKGYVETDLDMVAPALPPMFRDTLVRDGGGAESNNRVRLELDTNQDRLSLQVPALRLANLNLDGLVAGGVEIDDMVLSVEGVKNAGRDLAKPLLNPSALDGAFGPGGSQAVRLQIGRILATKVRNAQGIEAGTIVAHNLNILLTAGASGLKGALSSAQGVSTSFDLAALEVTKAKTGSASADRASLHGLSGKLDPSHGTAALNIADVNAAGVAAGETSVGSAGVHGIHAAADIDGDAPAMAAWHVPQVTSRATGEASIAGIKADKIKAGGMNVASAGLDQLSASATNKSVEGSLGHAAIRGARAKAGSVGAVDVKNASFAHGAHDEVSVGGVLASDLAAKDFTVGEVAAADLHAEAAGPSYEGNAGWVGARHVARGGKQIVDRATLIDASATRDERAGVHGHLKSASVQDVGLDGTSVKSARTHGVDGTWNNGTGSLSVEGANALGIHAHTATTDARVGWSDIDAVSAKTGGGQSTASVKRAAAGSIAVRQEMAAQPASATPSPVDLASLRATGSVGFGGKVSTAGARGELMHERAGDNQVALNANGIDDLAVSFIRLLVGQIHVDLGGAKAGVERASASGGVVKVQGDRGSRSVQGNIGAVQVEGVTASKKDGEAIAANATKPSNAELAGLVRDADLHGSVGLTPKRYGGSVLGATIKEHTKADASVQVHDGKLVPGRTGVTINPGVDLPGWFTVDGAQLEADAKDPTKGRVRPQLGGLPDIEATQFVPGMEAGVPLDLKELAGKLPADAKDAKDNHR